MIVEKGRFVGIDIGKRTWEMAVITRSGRMKKRQSLQKGKLRLMDG
jgi:predicted NBD/HSP70 family sugar kinase